MYKDGDASEGRFESWDDDKTIQVIGAGDVEVRSNHVSGLWSILKVNTVDKMDVLSTYYLVKYHLEHRALLLEMDIQIVVSRRVVSQNTK